MSADVPKTVRTVAAPPVLYYLAIDGTESQDAAVFGALLEGKGWKNLARYLDPAPDDPTRLVDPAHDFLPIPLVEAKGKKIAVVAPSGRDGKGLDKFWLRLEPRIENGRELEGRVIAARSSSRYMRQLILNPAIHTHEFADALKRHFPDQSLPYASRHAPSARILYISTHGYKNGTMVGNALRDRVDPRQPANATEAYFSLARAVRLGEGFHGPEWIILAQCSTMNRSVWALWARVLAASSPGVRGVLAYEDASPLPGSGVKVVEMFFSHLEQGAAFLDAWERANRASRWSALVHKEARSDTLTGISRWAKLSDVSTTPKRSNYRAYERPLGPAGEAVYDTVSPFRLKLEHRPAPELPFEPVLGEDLGPNDRFVEGHWYRWTVHGDDDLGTLREVRITVVHLRESFRDQPPWSKLFSNCQPADGIWDEGFGTATLVLRPERGVNPASITWQCRASAGKQAGLEADHSFLWFRVAVRTDLDNLQHDFKTVGLFF